MGTMVIDYRQFRLGIAKCGTPLFLGNIAVNLSMMRVSSPMRRDHISRLTPISQGGAYNSQLGQNMLFNHDYRTKQS